MEKVKIIGNYGIFKHYYVKPMIDNYTEVVMEKLANIIHLNCAHYDVKNIRGNSFYYSSDLNEGYIFVPAESLGINTNNLNDIIEVFKSFFGEEADKFNIDLIKMYAFDILTLNPDRTNKNYGTLNAKHYKELVILDNSACLYEKIPAQIKACGKKKRIEYDVSATYQNIEDLDYFLNNYKKKYTDIFFQVYNTLTPDVFVSVVSEIKEIPIEAKREMIRLYKCNYEQITNYIMYDLCVNTDVKLSRVKEEKLG